MTFNPDTLQAECPECAQLFEGPARDRHLDEHLDREHSGDEPTACDAGDPCPHPNLQPLKVKS